MIESLEVYTVRLPKAIKKSIRVLSARLECSQQELIANLVKNAEGSLFTQVKHHR